MLDEMLQVNHTSISMMQADRYNSDAPIEQRVAADRDEPFVVFHIGLRINAFWKIHRYFQMIPPVR